MLLGDLERCEPCCGAELTIAIVFTVALTLTAPSALTVSSSASSIAAEARACRRRGWCLGRRRLCGLRRSRYWRWRRGGRPSRLEVEARDEGLWRACADIRRPPHLGDLEGLRLSSDVVDIITRVPSLPEKPTHAFTTWARE